MRVVGKRAVATVPVGVTDDVANRVIDGGASFPQFVGFGDRTITLVVGPGGVVAQGVGERQHVALTIVRHLGDTTVGGGCADHAVTGVEGKRSGR